MGCEVLTDQSADRSCCSPDRHVIHFVHLDLLCFNAGFRKNVKKLFCPCKLQACCRLCQGAHLQGLQVQCSCCRVRRKGMRALYVNMVSLVSWQGSLTVHRRRAFVRQPLGRWPSFVAFRYSRTAAASLSSFNSAKPLGKVYSIMMYSAYSRMLYMPSPAKAA